MTETVLNASASALSVEPLPQPARRADAAPGEPDVPANPPQTNRLYAVVWRWHFYAGLLTAPILWVIVITGSLYVFRHELTAWRDRSLQVVEPQSQRMSYDALRTIAAEALSPHDPEALVVHPEGDRSIRFVAHTKEGGDRAPGQGHRHLYLNPYTGDILGTRVMEEDFFAVVLELHRSLMMGTTGRIVSELVTSWCVVLLLTGLYLWWPRGKQNVGVWVPRVRGKLYAVLRDWHAVAGFYLLPLMILVAGTGLFFTIVWGTTFNTTAKKLGHWPPQWFAIPKSPPPQPDAAPASLDAVVSRFLTQCRPEDAIMIRLPETPDESYRAFMMRDEDKNSLRLMTVHQYTAEPIAVIDVAELPLMYRMRVWAVSIHMGQIFGTPTKILAFLTTIGLLALSITGVWMWWERRPSRGTGFPRRPLPNSLPRWGWAVVALTALLMPVAGASMLAIGLVDQILFRLRRGRSASPA